MPYDPSLPNAHSPAGRAIVTSGLPPSGYPAGSISYCLRSVSWKSASYNAKSLHTGAPAPIQTAAPSLISPPGYTLRGQAAGTQAQSSHCPVQSHNHSIQSLNYFPSQMGASRQPSVVLPSHHCLPYTDIHPCCVPPHISTRIQDRHFLYEKPESADICWQTSRTRLRCHL